MRIYIVRHGISEANNRENIGTPAFGDPDAPLMQLGIEQARSIPQKLLAQNALVNYGGVVATSTLRRTQQTAFEAGFEHQLPYYELDEVEPAIIGMGRLAIKEMTDDGQLPEMVLREAEQTLLHPPQATLWFSHGLKIAGICKVLNQHQDKPLIPKFCEVRRLTL